VEFHSLATAKDGLRFDNRYRWIAYFNGALIVRVRAYLDSAWSPVCSRRAQLETASTVLSAEVGIMPIISRWRGRYGRLPRWR
jgi:hypothetical protein